MGVSENGVYPQKTILLGGHADYPIKHQIRVPTHQYQILPYPYRDRIVSRESNSHRQ